MEIRKKSEECYFCKKNAMASVSLVNTENRIWMFIPENSRAHSECYAIETMKIAIRQVLKEKEDGVDSHNG